MVRNKEDLRNIEVGITKVIIFDDYDWSIYNRVELISLFDYDFGSTIPARFADVLIPSEIKRIVLTNVALTDLNPKFTDPAVKRRYGEYELSSIPLYKDIILNDGVVNLILKK